MTTTNAMDWEQVEATQYEAWSPGESCMAVVYYDDGKWWSYLIEAQCAPWSDVSMSGFASHVEAQVAAHEAALAHDRDAVWDDGDDDMGFDDLDKYNPSRF